MKTISPLSKLLPSGILPLAVHVIMNEYQPNPILRKVNDQIEIFVDRLCERLASGERSPVIPVRLWRRVTGQQENKLPIQVPLHLADKNLILFIVDQSFFEARNDWDLYIRGVLDKHNPSHDVVIPISIHADAARVSSVFGDINHFFVRDPVRFADEEHIFQCIYTALLRLLNNELHKVFLCHAKAKSDTKRYGDGEKIAQDIRRYIYEETQLPCFFDLHDIPHGKAVKSSIEEAIAQSVVLVIWTDKLLDSPWCQFEIIEARRQQRPMLVLDALTSNTSRIFPFLGNMPIIRWQDNSPEIVSGVLLELLRTYHLQAVFNTLSSLEKCPPKFGLHPPDLLDSEVMKAQDKLNRKQKCPTNLFVYPDPPIKPNELEILKNIIPGKLFLSLIEWRSLRAINALQCDLKDPHPNPFIGKNIGISVSASDTWAEMGLIGQHQDDLAAAIALDLILLGAKVVWGGDLRPDGLGIQLKQIVQTYQHSSHPPQSHVGLVVPFTLDPTRQLNIKDLQTRRLFADVKILNCPLAKDPIPSDPESASAVALTALALSIMRSEMAHECHARILLGGSLKKFLGLYPGIAEEAYEAVQSKSPIYIIGGFGGAAKAVYETVSNLGDGREILLDACKKKGAAAKNGVIALHQNMVLEINREELKFDPEKMIKVFSSLGRDGLSESNGLTPIENERLAQSQNIHEIVELLVKGLDVISFKHN
jgi:SLOG cluster2/TIR domain